MKTISLTSQLTRREEHTIEMIIGMVEHPEFPRALVSLQECGHSFLNELQMRLSEKMKIISFTPEAKDQNVVIFNSDILTFDEVLSGNEYPFVNSQPERPIMNLTFRRGEEVYRIINTHAPGDPALPGRHDLAAYVANEHQEGTITLCMGDMNFNENEMREAFDRECGGYSLISPYPTNIGLDFYSKCIDHFFIKGTDDIEVNRPESLVKGLTEVIDLLTYSHEPIISQIKV